MLSAASACFDLKNVRASEEARAYITNLLTQFITTTRLDVSRTSLVLELAALTERFDFARAQRLGDGVTWLLIFAREHCEVPRVAVSIGQSAYAMCYRVMRSWRVFEELADTLPGLIDQVHNNLPVTLRSGFDPSLSIHSQLKKQP